MKWHKVGKIFDPTEHHLPNRCVEFAQSPQTLLLHDRIRVYFSTRERDKTDKFLSHVAYADFSRDMSKLLGISKHTVLSLGGLGCFDEHGIFPINVLRDNHRILAYTTGWNRKISVSTDAAIGLAISHDDGQTFERYGGTGPIMASSLHEPFLVGDAFVRRYGDVYHMWYIYGKKWQEYSENTQPDRVYKIAHAVSSDAINWQRNGQCIIKDKLNTDECQALPSVIFLNGIYHMFFCYRQASGFRTDSSRGYRIGYAYSTDLKNWTRDDEAAGINVSVTGWDAEMQCYPHVFECDGQVYLLYNGNDFGRYGFGLAVLEDA
ncbi:hypothetical protein [Castellaniella ginsengisoli]|uniref:Glycosylase n=1 Tax=Castellaniella ginsengisoli TaxID=546114 RepID=A0AB39FMT6_9BURK